jgi:hypothetical protein
MFGGALVAVGLIAAVFSDGRAGAVLIFLGIVLLTQ